MENTIAAICTAYGESGIGIIRISGDKALEILEAIFRSGLEIKGENNCEAELEGKYRDKNEVGCEKSIVNRRLTYGKIIDKQGKTVDEVLAVYMKAPATYTREDVVEINCHGSIVSQRKILELVISMGAVIAEPGEFTKRAFLNGRLDLTQAEAVIDLIKAKSDSGFDTAMKQLDGILSVRIAEIRGELLELLVDITVNIDYPDEDIEELTYSRLEKSLLSIGDKLEKLIATAETGKIIREGLSVAIIGKPNVGKSSLMNALMREQRAIVTEIPGTTRDTIEENITIGGILIKLVDTAGIRETEDAVEKIGIEKSKEAFNKSDLVILILDGSKSIEEEDLLIIDKIGDKKTIVLINKSDLGFKIDEARLKNLISNGDFIKTAIGNFEGIEAIEDKIKEMVYGGSVSSDESVLVSNVRHKNLLEEAKSSIDDGITMVLKKEALDFIEIDVNRAWELLGEITGETVKEDIIKEVFSRFCLGK